MRFDVIVVGAGQAGTPLATTLADEGKRVLLVERAHVGGTCVNTGCTPTKTMLASARAAHVARRAGRLGVRTGEVRVDLSAVVDRKDEIVRQWREGSRSRVEDAGENLTFMEGHARFVEERALEVAGERHSAETVVLNVGGRPVRPSVPGLDEVHALDNASIMELRELPDHLLVMGGGYIGCEFAQMFRRFGARVTIVQRADHLLNREDADISEAIEDVFRQEGIELRTGVDVRRVSNGAAEGSVRLLLDDGSDVVGSHLLVAVGRRPNTEDLGCERGGVELDDRGFIVVDEGYRTSAEGVYAVGDVIGGPQFTHTSWDDHRLLYDILGGREATPRSERLTPYAVFTDPQVARVGVSEREAAQRGIPYELATLPFESVARAIEIDEPAGVMKVLLDPATERVLGAAIVGAEAGELIHIFVVLMQANAPARAIVDVQHIHPSFAEGVQSLVMQLDRYA